jgi:hypothetical protein
VCPVQGSPRPSLALLTLACPGTGSHLLNMGSSHEKEQLSTPWSLLSAGGQGFGDPQTVSFPLWWEGHMHRRYTDGEWQVALEGMEFKLEPQNTDKGCRRRQALWYWGTPHLSGRPFSHVLDGVEPSKCAPPWAESSLPPEYPFSHWGNTGTLCPWGNLLWHQLVNLPGVWGQGP